MGRAGGGGRPRRSSDSKAASERWGDCFANGFPLHSWGRQCAPLAVRRCSAPLGSNHTPAGGRPTTAAVAAAAAAAAAKVMAVTMVPVLSSSTRHIAVAAAAAAAASGRRCVGRHLRPASARKRSGSPATSQPRWPHGLCPHCPPLGRPHSSTLATQVRNDHSPHDTSAFGNPLWTAFLRLSTTHGRSWVLSAMSARAAVAAADDGWGGDLASVLASGGRSQQPADAGRTRHSPQQQQQATAALAAAVRPGAAAVGWPADPRAAHAVRV